MKVIKAQQAGACYGVQRALEMALEAAQDSRGASTLGPLIHNPQVVKDLSARGIRVVDDQEDVQSGAVIIRSHGVTPGVLRSIEQRGLPIIDATCPHVTRAQRAAGKLARCCGQVIVVGEAGHPEVEGLVAWAQEAGGEVFVVRTPDDLPCELGLCVGIVVQTTQTNAALDAIVEALSEREVEVNVKNTICFATSQRQESAANLAQEVDAIVVIGGRNSSNTTRLAEICAMTCSRTYHIESPSELDPKWFEGCQVAGVTAGASTPESQIAAVVEILEAL